MRAVPLAVALFALGCTKQGAVAPERAQLRVVVTPPNASVYIDGHYFGRATVLAQEPKSLSPGVHLMTVTADDYFPHDMELDLRPGETTLEITLRPIPP